MIFPQSDWVAVFCTGDVSRNIKGIYRFPFIEFTQQHPTPPREVMTSLVITSLFFCLPELPFRGGPIRKAICKISYPIV